MNASRRALKLNGLLLAAALGLTSLGAPAFAQTASPTPTARAKAVVRNAAGTVKGTVYFSEYESSTGTNGHRIDVTGRITGLTPGSHGLHLWNGSCSGPGFSNAGMHVDFTGEPSESFVHPRAEGDLPNVVADSTGVANIRFTKFTNRFGLSSQSLSRGQNVFAESGPVAVGIDTNPATATSADVLPILCGALVCDAGSCISPTVPQSGLVAHWKFDEGSGGTALDATQRGHDATWQGTGTRYLFPGRHGPSAATFNGSDDFLTAPASTDFVFGTGDFSLVFWFFPTLNDDKRPIVNNRIVTQDGTRWAAEIYDLQQVQGNQLGFHSDVTILLDANRLLTGSAWNSVAITRAAGILTIFIDGTSAGSVANGNNFSTLNVLQIGRDLLGPNDLQGRTLAGHLDDLAIYQRALTPAEIAAIASAP